LNFAAAFYTQANMKSSFRSLLALGLLSLLAVPLSYGWGSKGHTIINRLAAENLPADLPAFIRTPEAINEIAYLGPEPDRWRSRAEPELVAAQAPDHFIDIEYADLIGTLPRQRYQYIAALYAYIAAHPDRAADLRPEKVGFQPYITSEVWERLKSSMRDYRELSAKHEDTKPVEAAILFYAGWLGHYVADGSQPLHVTINYNGWAEKENPNGYTTDHTIHWRFEGPFVDAAINTSDVQPLLAPLHPIHDEWDDYLAYLRHTSSFVEQVYQLDKQHGFDGTGTPESRQFTAERLAAGASMLRDMYVAAWVKSAEPVPDWHDQHENPEPSTPKTTNTTDTLQPSDTPIYHFPFPEGFTQPKIRYEPDLSNRGKTKGVVVVSLIVDETGKPKNIRITRHLSDGTDQIAIEAAKKYRFTPAKYKGKPVSVEIAIEVSFGLGAPKWISPSSLPAPSANPPTAFLRPAPSPSPLHGSAAPSGCPPPCSSRN
jgi:TonB family protein